MATKFNDMAVIVGRLAQAYDKTVSIDQARAYHTALCDFPRMVLVTATTQLISESKFFPRPSEIVTVAKRISTTYTEPEWAKDDEAMYWYLYTHNMTSTDELTDKDVQAIYKSVGVEV